MTAKLIALYLPSFHKIRENNKAWGEGWTEWDNVRQGTPQYEGHHQPKYPLSEKEGGLGFYDLADPEVLALQAKMAKSYGIYGFCFYYYWFSGKSVLRTPVNNLIAHPEIDLPFCVCWANENWTRKWDGKEHEIILKQEYYPADVYKFIKDLGPILQDPRYMTVNGKKVLCIYRTENIPYVKKWAASLRKYAKELFNIELYLVRTESLHICYPAEIGFDAAYEMPPHQYPLELQNKKFICRHGFTGRLYFYEELIDKTLNTHKNVNYPLFRGIIPAWDNTARIKNQSHILVGSNPKLYKEWLKELIAITKEEFIFINAWNEHGEGAAIEPNQPFGFQYLEATREAINGN